MTIRKHPFNKEDMLFFINLRKKLKKIALNHDEFGIDSNDLCGACAISAYTVYRYFKAKGRNPLLVHGEGHCWTEVNGYIIDLTATQFEGKPIYIAKADDTTSHLHYDYNRGLIDKCGNEREMRQSMDDLWDIQHPLNIKKKKYKYIIDVNKQDKKIKEKARIARARGGRTASN